MSAEIYDIDRGFTVGTNWHRLPQYEILADDATVTSAMIAGIAPTYDIADPVYVWVNPETGEPETRPMNGKRVIIDHDHGHVVGIGSDGYRENQPSEWMGVVAEVAERQGFRVVSAGTLSQRAKTFVSIALEGFEMTFGTHEITLPFVNFGDAVNGTSRFRAAAALNRIVCNNTFQAYLTGVPAIAEISHTVSGPAKVAHVLQALDTVIAEQKSITEAVDQLINSSYTEAQFYAMLKDEDMLGARPEDEGRARTEWDKMHDSFRAGYNDPTNDEIRETAWGAMQAIQFAEQNTMQVRKVSREERHAERVLFSGQKYSNIASGLIRAEVGMPV